MSFKHFFDDRIKIFNTILSFIYIPMSIVGLSFLLIPDGTVSKYSEIKIILLNFVIYLGLSLPFLSFAGIFFSVIARMKGKRKFAFIIQFLPIPFFLMMVVLFLLMGLV